jgi:hypothetical protein
VRSFTSFRMTARNGGRAHSIYGHEKIDKRFNFGLCNEAFSFDIGRVTFS